MTTATLQLDRFSKFEKELHRKTQSHKCLELQQKTYMPGNLSFSLLGAKNIFSIALPSFVGKSNFSEADIEPIASQGVGLMDSINLP